MKPLVWKEVPGLRMSGEAAPPAGQRRSCRVNGQKPLKCRIEWEGEAGEGLAGLGCDILEGGHTQKPCKTNK